MTEPEGRANQLRCPYHGWTYSLEGELKGTPDFSGVCDFEQSSNGLVPVETAVWEKWVFVRIEGEIDRAPDAFSTLTDFLGIDLIRQILPLDLDNLHWMERRH